MHKSLIVLFFCISCLACEKDKKGEVQQSGWSIARITGFDLNCSTCILEFPVDSSKIKEIAGESSGNLYEALNLNKEGYKEGQLLSVRIRQPEKDELLPCITLYPSYDYKALFVTEFANSEQLTLNDTLDIYNKSCKFNIENQLYLCLDSVLNDNRCPEGAQCIIAGQARIRFHYEMVNQPPVYFILTTDPLSAETNIDRYKITLIDLFPKPTFFSNEDRWRPKARLLIREIQQ